MMNTIVQFKGGYYRHYEDQHHNIKTIHFDCAPYGQIGNIDIYKVDGGYCLVNEYGEFVVIR